VKRSLIAKQHEFTNTFFTPRKMPPATSHAREMTVVSKQNPWDALGTLLMPVATRKLCVFALNQRVNAFRWLLVMEGKNAFLCYKRGMSNTHHLPKKLTYNNCKKRLP
jgi:hypothetical protein